MNSLDQAFIKAFSKDRLPTRARGTATRQIAKPPRAVVQPPEEGQRSVPLVLHDEQQPDRRLRIDRPAADAGGLSSLVPHMILPIVEHVETYCTEDLEGIGPELVRFEDRLTWLGMAVVELPETEALELDAVADAAAVQVVTELPVIERCPTQESNVRDRRDANEDREVPTLAPSVDDLEDESRTSYPVSEDDIEVRVLAECQPRVTLVAPALRAPELMVHELMMPVADPLASDVSAVLPALTAMEVELPQVDLDLLGAAAARHARSTEQRCTCDEMASVAVEGGPAVVEPSERVASVAAERPAEETLPDIEEPPAAKQSAFCAEEGRRELVSFTPAWEVDAFRWPEVCLQLDQQTGGKLQQSGEELFVATGDGLKVLAVTSTSRCEGRSTLALALAQSAARAGSHVALLDADAANPQLASRLGLESPCDWYDVASREQALTEAAVTSLEDGVTLFPLAGGHDALAESRDPMLAGTLYELSRFFDLVVVDLPPIAAPRDGGPGPSLVPIDMAVVVRDMRSTPQTQTLTTVSTLRKLGVRAVGIIENFTPSHDAQGNE